MSTENISANIIEAHKISVIKDGTEPGTLIVNGTNIVDKIEENNLKCQTLENKINLHKADISTSTPPSRFHLTTDDIDKINTVTLKANQSELNLLETAVENISTTVDNKADISVVDELASKCVTYRIEEGDTHKLIELENLVFFNHDLTIENARLVMQNNNIVLHNNCANIEGPESDITIKNVKANNLVEVTGTGVAENKGDVTIERNEEKYSVWGHLTNNVKHITQEERDRWNAGVDINIFFIADADSAGHPNIDNPNSTVIYLVKDNESVDAENYYKKWAWVEHVPGSGDYQWEKMGSANIDLSGYATKEELNAHAINTSIHISTPAQIEAVNSGITPEKVTQYNEYRTEIDALKSPHFILVDELPETGMVNFIYLIPKTSPVEKNIKEEYIWVETETEAHWEKIGDTAIDLSNYATKDELATHTTNSDIHVTTAKKQEWDSKISSINLNASTSSDITDTSNIVGNTIIHNFALNKVVSGSSITTGEARIPTAGAVADYVTNTLANNYVNKAGDTMTGGLTINSSNGLTLNGNPGQPSIINVNKGSIKLDNASGVIGEYSSIGHLTAGNTTVNPDTGIKFTDVSSNGIVIKNEPASGALNNYTNITNEEIFIYQTSKSSGEIQDAVHITNDGSITATVDITTGTVNTGYIQPAVGNKITVRNGILSVEGGLASSFNMPHFGNTINFYNTNDVGAYTDINLVVSATTLQTENAPIVKISAEHDSCDVTIAGKSVYDHITDPHLHLSDNQLKILNAAEHGCFAYGPVEPDASRPDEPYKLKNPKLILKQINADNNYGEAALQVGTTNQAYIEAVNTSTMPNTVSISSGYEHGNTIEVTDNSITLKTANPSAAIQNANVKIMGNTAIGDASTSYSLKLNGQDIGAISTGIDITENTTNTVKMRHETAHHVELTNASQYIEIQKSDESNKIVYTTILCVPGTNRTIDSTLISGVDHIEIFGSTNTANANKITVIDLTEMQLGATKYIVARITPNVNA